MGWPSSDRLGMPGRSTVKNRVALAVTGVVLAASVITAWAIDAASSDAVYRIAVVRGDTTIAEFDLEDLSDMPSRKVKMQAQTQQGPALLEVLEESGVSQFKRVVVKGSGVRDSGRIVLDRSDIDDDVLLDLAARGTAKLCGPNIAWEDRVRDVERIEVW